MCLPSGEMIQTPPGPALYIFPLWSTFIPSGEPSRLSEVASNKTFPSVSVPSALTVYRIHSFFGSELFT